MDKLIMFLTACIWGYVIAMIIILIRMNVPEFMGNYFRKRKRKKDRLLKQKEILRKWREKEIDINDAYNMLCRIGSLKYRFGSVDD